eukprot:5252033-Prymnesium_polylepis.1
MCCNPYTAPLGTPVTPGDTTGHSDGLSAATSHIGLVPLGGYPKQETLFGTSPDVPSGPWGFP